MSIWLRVVAAFAAVTLIKIAGWHFGIQATFAESLVVTAQVIALFAILPYYSIQAERKRAAVLSLRAAADAIDDNLNEATAGDATQVLRLAADRLEKS